MLIFVRIDCRWMIKASSHICINLSTIGEDMFHNLIVYGKTDEKIKLVIPRKLSQPPDASGYWRLGLFPPFSCGSQLL